ncbi:MAG: RluA family pseudouridine synthase [Kiritimatiellae bacterium]|nr:RluA family pseudouridine synthase [Kiritimatiellia bacterium]
MKPDIIYQDNEILVVNKAAGIFVHKAPGHESESLADALVELCPQMKAVGSVERPGVVHRLDEETSGVMVFAKTDAAYYALREQFERHDTIKKTYLGIVHGVINPRKGTIREPIKGKSAVTHWEVLQKAGSVSMVEFRIETGRMHQIRLHAKALGHPIVGDKLYGDKRKDGYLRPRPARQLLHAVELTFNHPKTGRSVTFAAPPPGDML